MTHPPANSRPSSSTDSRPDAPADQVTVSRRGFVSCLAAAAVAAPAVLTARKTDSPVILGEGEHRYEAHHHWAQLPAPYSWQTTHNVAVDAEGLVYVIHEGRENLADHPSIFVFDPQGRYVRSFGSQFQGGGHGIEVRQEGSQQFLYVCAYQQVKAFAKLTLTGETVWHQFAPMESGVYAEGEASSPKKAWGRNRFMPTNFAFLPDGSFYLADGYGSYYIHHYNAAGKWQSCFGGPGEGEGKFNTPHGIWVDDRPGREPQLVICDRAHHTLQFLSLKGEHLKTQTGFGLPANVDRRGGLLLVPELVARVTLLDEKDQVAAYLGDDRERVQADKSIRGDQQKWQPGKFVHPHDACFDHDGNILVAEWVGTGRVSLLKKLA